MGNGVILRKLRLWCLLLLAAVATHALLPITMPEARASGSPFSPATIDVSTGHNRREAVEPQVTAGHDHDDDGTHLPFILALIPVPGPVTADLSNQAQALPSASAATPTSRRDAQSQPRAPPRA